MAVTTSIRDHEHETLVELLDITKPGPTAMCKWLQMSQVHKSTKSAEALAIVLKTDYPQVFNMIIEDMKLTKTNQKN